jgi:hypothetical protein
MEVAYNWDYSIDGDVGKRTKKLKKLRFEEKESINLLVRLRLIENP